MAAYTFFMAKAFLYVALTLFAHDMLNYLEYRFYEPTTLIELWQLGVNGVIDTKYTTGSSFWDKLFSWPGFVTFGLTGGIMYTIFRGFKYDYY